MERLSYNLESNPKRGVVKGSSRFHSIQLLFEKAKLMDYLDRGMDKESSYLTIKNCKFC